ncbi:MAG: hypothetical protein JWR36_245 [Glaciihabitans sp.]|nr:hypothetical protein [Glaciihabitans sp.]
MTTSTSPAKNDESARRQIKNWHTAQKQKLTRGERSADRMRNFMGSWRFVGGFVAFMLIWAALNLFLPTAWDKYPFILLNLFLSMLAGLQGAILLIAAKRQDAIAAALAEHDYNTNVASKKDIEALMKLTKEQCIMLDELKVLIADQQKTTANPRAKV